MTTLHGDNIMLFIVKDGSYILLIIINHFNELHWNWFRLCIKI